MGNCCTADCKSQTFNCMRREIMNFVLAACAKFKIPLSLAYFPSEYQEGKFDIFSISIHGKYLLNLTNKNFHDIPKAERMNHFLPLINVGLNHNLGERSLKDQVELPRRHGITLIRNGVARYGC